MTRLLLPIPTIYRIQHKGISLKALQKYLITAHMLLSPARMEKLLDGYLELYRAFGTAVEGGAGVTHIQTFTHTAGMNSHTKVMSCQGGRCTYHSAFTEENLPPAQVPPPCMAAA